MRKSLFPGLNLFWSNIFFLVYFEELLSWRIILIFEDQFESVFLRRNPHHLRHHLFISAGIFRNHKIRFEQTKLYTFHLENISRSLSLNGLEELEFLKIPSPSFLNFLFHRIKDALCLTQYNLPSTISPLHTRTLVERWPIPKPRFLKSNNIFTIIRRERKKEEPKKHGPSKSSRQNIGITRKISHFHRVIYTGVKGKVQPRSERCWRKGRAKKKRKEGLSDARHVRWHWHRCSKRLPDRRVVGNYLGFIG